MCKRNGQQTQSSLVEATKDNILLAAKLLRNGELVAFPTETVYGLGANALLEDAVSKIFKAKKRPKTNPIILHIGSFEQITLVADLENLKIFNRLNKVKDLWPGPISLILPKSKRIPYSVTAGKETLAIRIPDHPIALSLLQICNFPIAAPSANKSGYVSPTSAEHVLDLAESVSLILNGNQCKVGIESTVLDITQSKPIILREGAITKNILENILNEEVQKVTNSVDKSLSPGLHLKHYTPKTKIIFEHNLPKTVLNSKVCFLGIRKNSNQYKSFVLSENNAIDEIRRNLYSTLRKIDQLNFEYIVIDKQEFDSLEPAVLDRLSRALNI